MSAKDSGPPTEFRLPLSILVVVYTGEGKVLLLRRSRPFDFWQSITGSLQAGETHAQAAVRELGEETGLAAEEGTLAFSGNERRFTIDPRWRHRYAPGVTENAEFEWRYRLQAPQPVRLNHREHSEYCWEPIDVAIERVWSWTNREALVGLRESLG